MAPPILAASTPIPSNAITITLKILEITVSITAPNQAHPLPFKKLSRRRSEITARIIGPEPYTLPTGVSGNGMMTLKHT